MTITTLESIRTEIASLIGDRFYLTTDQQSFDRYPTNHINVITDDCAVEVGTIVYDEVTQDKEILECVPHILKAFEFQNLDGWILSIGRTAKGSYNITLESEPDQHSGDADIRQGWTDSADQIYKVLIGLLCQ